MSPVGEEVDVARLRDLAQGVLNLLADPGIVYSGFPGCRPWQGDADYIHAANPATVLALIARLEAAESARGEALAVVERVRALADEWKAAPQPPGEDYEGTTEGHYAFGEWLATTSCATALHAALTPSAPTEEPQA